MRGGGRNTSVGTGSPPEKPRASERLGSTACVKAPFREVVLVRSNGSVQGLPAVVRCQESRYHSGQHAHKVGPDAEERGKGITFFLLSFGANGDMQGEVSTIDQDALWRADVPSQPSLCCLGSSPLPRTPPPAGKYTPIPLGLYGQGWRAFLPLLLCPNT